MYNNDTSENSDFSITTILCDETKSDMNVVIPYTVLLPLIVSVIYKERQLGLQQQQQLLLHQQRRRQQAFLLTITTWHSTVTRQRWCRCGLDVETRQQCQPSTRTNHHCLWVSNRTL